MRGAQRKAREVENAFADPTEVCDRCCHTRSQHKPGRYCLAITTREDATAVGGARVVYCQCGNFAAPE